MNVRIATLGLALMLASCGGGAPARPSPLNHNLEDMTIASVAVDAKQNVVQSKQELDVAQMERAKTQSDLGELGTQLAVAQNEAKQADLQASSAQAEKDAAVKSANVNRQTDAEQKVRAADMAKKAAQAKVEWLESRKDGLDRQEIYQEWNASARDARYQLEKAKVAQANGIRPQGFDMPGFEKQAADRSDGALRAKADADQAVARSEEKHKQYLARQQEADAANGAAAPAPAAK